MAIDYVALKAELQTDPTALGYSVPFAAGNDLAVSDILNLVRVAIQLKRIDVTAAEVWSAINTADMVALPASPTAAQLSDERRKLAWLSGVAAVSGLRLQNDNGTDTPVVTMAKSIFTAGSATLTRLGALALRSGSRAEQLFGSGVVIVASDIVKARAS